MSNWQITSINPKLLNNLGLVKRANKLITGFKVWEQFDKIKLLIIATDCSDATKERILKKIHHYHIPYIMEFTSEQLSKAIKLDNRKIIAIDDLRLLPLFIKEEEYE